METCSDGHAHVHDKDQLTADGKDRDALVGNGVQRVPAARHRRRSTPPRRTATRAGLTDLGEYTIRRMIDKKMIIDPDHMSVIARKQTMALVEAEKYSGVVSSHSWSTPDVIPRIYKLGGFVTPYAGSSSGFVDEWNDDRPMRSRRHYFGFGYGADMNGFGAQGGPRTGAKNPVSYPFRSFDGSVTLARQRSGMREFDINKDGVAHYGLYPDWVEDLRKIAGKQIVDDMARGSEAYLHMWERAEGVRNQACRSRARALHAPRPRPGAGRSRPRGLPARRWPADRAQGPRVPLLRGRPPEAQGGGGVHPRRQGRPGGQHGDRPHHRRQDRPRRPRKSHPLEDQALRQVLPHPPRGLAPDRVPRPQGQDPLYRGRDEVGGEEPEAPAGLSTAGRPALAAFARLRPERTHEVRVEAVVTEEPLDRQPDLGGEHQGCGIVGSGLLEAVAQ